jgi:hypothetical protein
MERIARDERGVVVEWLVKMMAGLALAGIVVFDLAAIVVNHITLDSTANDIAIDLSTDLAVSSPGPVDARLTARAKELARAAKARLVRLELDDAGVLHVRLARHAQTIVISRVEPLRKWGRSVAGGQASTS